MKKVCLFILSTAIIGWSCNKNETLTGPGEEEEIVFDAVTVVEYTPAPGQFINDGYQPADMAEAVEWAQGRIDDNLFVSLGAFGGYIVLRPSKAITNSDGYDFGIAGNPIPTHNEPGIVWVARDADGDGVPDRWFALKGSEAGRRDYSVTYFRPDGPGDVEWLDGDGDTGVVKHLSSFHAQDYYPAWCDRGGSFTLTGTLLEPKHVTENNQDRNEAYGWGYVDNLGSDVRYDEKDRYICNRFDISDVMDADGNPAALDRVDFIKVQSALLYNMGSTGELSTEVAGLIIFD